MRYLAVIGVLGFLATGIPAFAQVAVTAQTQRSNFLLYERVDILINVTDIGDSDIVLNNDEHRPWLTFLLSRHTGQNYMPIRQERDSTFAPITLKAGESKLFRVNITPLFTFREEGQFRVAAVIDLPGQGEVVSDNVVFNVQRGNNVWSQSRPVDGSQRIYSLLRFSPDNNTTDLYLRVENPDENLVYANVKIGSMVSSVDPSVFFDPAGNVHVLHPAALGTYLYTRADPNGKVIHQGIFKTEAVGNPMGGVDRIPPQLAKLNDGNVTVIGGVEEDPNKPRERLSDGQVTTATNTAAPHPAPTPATK